MEFAIEARALTKRYRGTTALDAVDFAVAPGTVFGMIGPNGAGKTTTMRLLLDIIRPTSGSAQVLGADARSGSALRRRMGYLPGDLRLDGHLTGQQLLRYLARISGPVDPTTIAELTDRFDVDLTRRIRTLSKGNRQKLGIVQAFMHRPELIVLDEPTSGLDPLAQRAFLDLIVEVCAAGSTVFLSSHVLSEVQQAATTVAFLRDGRIITQSDVDSLRMRAIRHVTVTIPDAAPDDVRAVLQTVPTISELRVTEPTGFGASAISGAQVTATIDGAIDPFVKAIARFSVADLVVEEPDLEESVLRLYSADSPHEAIDSAPKGRRRHGS